MRPAKKRNLSEEQQRELEDTLARLEEISHILGVETPRKAEAVNRGKISEQTISRYLSAREGDDIQTQLDIVFEIITGVRPDATTDES